MQCYCHIQPFFAYNLVYHSLAFVWFTCLYLFSFSIFLKQGHSVKSMRQFSKRNRVLPKSLPHHGLFSGKTTEQQQIFTRMHKTSYDWEAGEVQAKFLIPCQSHSIWFGKGLDNGSRYPLLEILFLNWSYMDSILENDWKEGCFSYIHSRDMYFKSQDLTCFPVFETKY